MDTAGQVVTAPSRPASRFVRRLERLFLCGVIAVLGWFYWWTINGDGAPLQLGRKQEDYFNLLMHGFLSGHLYLMRPVPAGLINAEDPYDPAKRPPDVGMHDVSYYRGHYYLYFGATPVVALFLPFRLVTGRELPMALAFWILAFTGLLAGAAVWWDLRRRYFPASGPLVALCGLLILGVVSLVPALLRRPSFWELPIASGYCFLMLALAGIWAALHARRPAWGLAAAAVGLGLAVGSRPTYVFGSSLLVVPLAWLWWRGRREGRWRWWPGRCWWWQVAAVAVPLGLLGSALALYNYQRFGTPLEFGLRYQLNMTNEMAAKHFRPSFVPYNAYLYFFAPAQWGRYFPFVHFIHPPVAPGGYYAWEYVWGAGTNLPILWLALLAPWASWRRGGSDAGRLGALGLTLVVAAGAQAAILLFFDTAALRYMVDFVPVLALGAACGLLALERGLQALRRPVLRLGARLAWGATALFSVFVAVMISFEVHGVLAQLNPERYHRLADYCNRLPAEFERLAGIRYGPLEITLWFGRVSHGTEPVLTTGWEFQSDRLLVTHVNDHEVRFIFDHLSQNTRVSPAVPIDFRVPHVLRVQAGSLFPPSTHPFYRGMNDFEVGMLRRWLKVTLDGQVMFDCSQTFYAASPEALHLGYDPIIHPNEPGAHFSGEILRARRLPYEVLHDAVNQLGTVRMQVRFRKDPWGRAEPLLSVGQTGKGGVVYVRYLEGTRAVFGIDQWGAGAREGPPVDLDEDREMPVEIRLPSFYPAGGPPERRALIDRAMVLLEGRVVFNRVLPAVDAGPDNVWIGMNRVNSSTCDQEFTGAISGLQRIMEGPAHPVSGGAARLRLQFPTDRLGGSEPLVVTGRAGAGDFLIVRYVDAHTIQFGHDHWGSPLQWSAPIAVDYAAPHVVEVDLASLHPGAAPAGLAATLDGRPVWVAPDRFFPATPEVSFGRNAIGGSACDLYFHGAIFAIDRLPVPPEDTARSATAAR